MCQNEIHPSLQHKFIHDSKAMFYGFNHVYNLGGPHASICGIREGRRKKAEDIVEQATRAQHSTKKSKFMGL